MSRLTHALIALLLIAGPVSADTAKALELVPHDALGFILIKDLSQLSDKVDKLAKKLEVKEFRSLLDLIRTEMGIREGLDDKGTALILSMKGKKEHTLRQPVFALPVSDRAKMLAQLGVKDLKARISKGGIGAQSGLLFSIGGSASDSKVLDKTPVLVALKGDFVLLASPADRDALEQILDSKKSVAASAQPAHEWLDEQDICGVCTPTGIDFGIAMFLGGPEGVIGVSTPGQLATMKTTFAEMQKNVTLIAFGTRIEKEGHARLLTRVYFEPKGSYAAWMAKAAPLAGDILARLPDQPYLVAAMARLSAQTSFDGLRQVLPEKMPPDQADKLMKDVHKVLQRISEAGLLVYTNEPAAKSSSKVANDKTGIAFLAKVDDAPAFIQETMQALLQTHQAMQKYGGNKTEVKTEQKGIAEKPSWLITIRTPIGSTKDDAMKPTEFSEETFLLTEIDANTVLGAVLSKGTQAETVVKAYSQKPAQALGANRGLKETASLLPKELQIVAFISMANVVKVKKETAPLAFALRTLPAGVEAQFVVPFDALKALFDPARAERTQSVNNLKQIALALHSYHDVNKQFPPAGISSIKDPTGKPLLSWRVAILPYLEEGQLYKEFDLTQPWDHPTNKKLIPRMPKVYRTPSTKTKEGHTHYRVLVGPGSIFELGAKVSLASITDGTSNTILAVEAADPTIWTRPEELPFDPKGALPKLGISPEGFNAVFADAAVHFLRATTPEADLRAFITRAGGEVVRLPD